jgi:hypothetical protein
MNNNLFSMIHALLGPQYGQHGWTVPPPPIKDQSRVPTTPYPSPVATMHDIPPGLMMHGSQPILSPSFQQINAQS